MTTGLFSMLFAVRQGRLGIDGRAPGILFIDLLDPPPGWEDFEDDDWNILTSRQKEQAFELWQKLSEKNREYFMQSNRCAICRGVVQEWCPQSPDYRCHPAVPVQHWFFCPDPMSEARKK